MNAEQVFKIQYEDFLSHLKSGKVKDCIQLSNCLRTFLLDGLIDNANKNYKLKIKYAVGKPVEDSNVEYEKKKGKYPSSNYIFNFRSNDPKVPLRINDFLKFNLVYFKPEFYNVKDIIKICANNLGGVHFDKKKKHKKK